MPLQFIQNEYPGYCVLITFYMMIKALRMSFSEFRNNLLSIGINLPKNEKIRKWWDDIHHGKAEYNDLKRAFFREDTNGKSMYDEVDPFVELIYEIQNGMNVTDMINRTKNWNTVHTWDNKKLAQWYDCFKNRCEEVPFVVEFLNFENKDLVPQDHVYITTMQPGLNGMFKIRNYNSDRDGVIETYSKEFICPLIYGLIDEFPDEGELPDYKEKKPGGIGK